MTTAKRLRGFYALAGGVLLSCSAVADVKSAEPVQAIPSPSAASGPAGNQGPVASSPVLAQASGVSSKSAASPRLTPAQQIKGIYVTAGFGANWPTAVTANELTGAIAPDYSFQDSHNSAFSVEAGLGYDFGAIRAELTYAYDASYLNSYTDGFGTFQYVSSPYANKQSVLASAYWDINLNSRFSPYIGAGLGYSNLTMSTAADQFNPYNGYSGGAFAYQFKAGLSYLVSKRSDLFAEAVYRGMTSYPVTDNGLRYSYGNYNSWGFQLGARYRF